MNKPEITPPSNSNHFRDGTGLKGSQYWFFVDGLGPIAVIDRQHISALLFFKKDINYGKVLQSDVQ